MSFISDIFGGGDKTTTVNNVTPPMSQEELDLIGLNKQLAQKQLASIDQLAPFQKQLLDLSMSQLQQQAKVSDAYASTYTPERVSSDAARQSEIDRLQLQNAQSDAERAQRLGPVQDQLLQLQLDQLKQGGRATPEQLQQIKDAADAGITAGTADINTQTKRGIGLIADELANSRGLRLSDSPISGEAALLARAGSDQVASLTNNLRAGQASAALNFPLSVQQVQSGINQNQQTLANSAQNFQAQLRQQAYQNRLALTGQAQTGGIGLASIGAGSGALSSLSANRMANSSSTSTTSGGGIGLGALAGIGSILSGGAAAAPFFGFKAG